MVIISTILYVRDKNYYILFTDLLIKIEYCYKVRYTCKVTVIVLFKRQIRLEFLWGPNAITLYYKASIKVCHLSVTSG